MTRLLVIDDQLSDLNIATTVARSLGIDQVKAMTSVLAARVLLESALDGRVPLPDLIVLDLDLGYESGHELLRFWHRNLRSAGVKVIVWTVSAEEQREICKLFGVQSVVSKWDGVDALKEAVEDCCWQQGVT